MPQGPHVACNRSHGWFSGDRMNVRKRGRRNETVHREERAWLTAAARDLAFFPSSPSPFVQTPPTHSPCSGGAVCLCCELSPSIAPSEQGVHLVLQLIFCRELLCSPSVPSPRQTLPIDPNMLSRLLEPQPLIPSRHSNLGSRYQSTGISTRDKNEVSPSIYFLLI